MSVLSTAIPVGIPSVVFHGTFPPLVSAENFPLKKKLTKNFPLRGKIFLNNKKLTKFGTFPPLFSDVTKQGGKVPKGGGSPVEYH